MSVEQFREFIDHAYWGRDKILDALEGAPEGALTGVPPLEGSRSISEIAGHMMGFERLFGAVISGGEPIFGAPDGDLSSVAGIRAAWEPIEAGWRQYLETLGDQELERDVHLTWWGPDAVVRVQDILAQFVQHQGQHRSELAVLATDLGCSPGEFDWWVYLQQRDEQVAGTP